MTSSNDNQQRPVRRLSGKVAIVTGAGGGIGRASALRFAEEGAAVVVTDIDAAANDETAALVAGVGGRSFALAADVASSDQLRELVSVAESEFGRLDIMFNNAGVMMSSDGDAESTDEDTMDTTFAINIKGVLFGCKHAIPAMRRSGGGSIINTASFVASIGAATPQVAYTASKGAVLSLTRELAVVHAREGIRVNALSPGPLHTELLMSFLDTDEKKNRRLVHVPMGRFGQATEMANAALFLASDESSFMTGSNLVIDGGITAAYVTPE